MQTTLTQEEPFEGRTSTELAAGCFTIGTLFFILFLTLQDASFISIIGFIFIIAAVFLNIIMLVHLLYHFLHITPTAEIHWDKNYNSIKHHSHRIPVFLYHNLFQMRKFTFLI